MSEEKKSVGETEAADLEEEVSSQAAAESGEEEEGTSAAEAEEAAGGSEWSPGFAKGAGGRELIFRKQTQLRLTQNSPININVRFFTFPRKKSFVSKKSLTLFFFFIMRYLFKKG